MTQNELKKLHRVELLELLIEQTKRADALEEEVASLKAQLAAKEIDIQNAGTLAEAAIKINEVLAAADAAAQQYLYNVKRMTGNLPEEPIADETETDPSGERIEETDEPAAEQSGEAEVPAEEEPEGKKASKRGKHEKRRTPLKERLSKKKKA